MTATLSSNTLAAGTWGLDPLHSNAGFSVRHLGIAWLRGTMTDFDVDFVVSEDGAIAFRGSSTVAAIHTKNESLAGHLASPDFFDAELNPTIEFVASDVQLLDDQQAVIKGQLAMAGQTHPLELRGTWTGPVADMGGSDRIGLELKGEVDRHAYGISWNAPLAGGGEVLGPKVILEGSFELARQ